MANGFREVRRTYGVISLILLAGLLYAGLKPFHAPENQVAWVPGHSGLHFSGLGAVLSTGFLAPSASTTGGRSLEIILRPDLVDRGETIVAFYDPRALRYFSINQSLADLELEITPNSAWRREPVSRIYLGQEFQDRKSGFWTVTSGASGIAVYRDGKLKAQGEGFRISRQDFSGRLIVGTSPHYGGGWSGILSGLAVYDRLLLPADVVRHYRSWVDHASPEITREDDCVALYLFDERSGNRVRDRTGSGYDLDIPDRFSVPDQAMLDPVWRAIRWSRTFWEDALINVAGFVPAGFFFCGYLSFRGFRRPAVLATLLGSALSLAIEVAQAHIPTRDSSMSDLVTNVAGTAIGTVVYRLREKRTRRSLVAPAASTDLLG
jgi:VanZ like protein